MPECSDDFFAGISGDGGGMLGFDEFEGDYFGLDAGYESRIACEEAEKRLIRLVGGAADRESV